eukprot:Awhi_evm1s4805
MPHLITNRQRHYHHFKVSHLSINFEVFNFVAYLIGGLFFIIGSVFFLPQYEQYANAGAWLFIIGSILYLLVAIHDVYEAVINWIHKDTTVSAIHFFEFLAAVAYFTGSIIFIIGSVFFLESISKVVAGSWLFIVGSLIFCLGSMINIGQMWTVVSPLMIQLLNATAVNFLVGSLFFILGSVFFIIPFENEVDSYNMYVYAGWLFIAGSICFTAGALINGVRSLYSSRFHGDIKKKMKDISMDAHLLQKKKREFFHKHALVHLHGQNESKNQIAPSSWEQNSASTPTTTNSNSSTTAA